MECQQRQGLSPRLRGNRGRDRRLRLRPGSIPAPAGEPPAVPSGVEVTRVYPRACGGTTWALAQAWEIEGLSPRLRGNPMAGPYSRIPSGSIPAPAGEPYPSACTLALARVYPRACGGTVARFSAMDLLGGLSPRLRGNRLQQQVSPQATRSIPAPAGEPVSPMLAALKSRVYPRACGGTAACGLAPSTAWGLSPRLRGNPPGGQNSSISSGSIPAPAGEPRCGLPNSREIRVYPRACGGTAIAGYNKGYDVGLSPRLRGNHGKRLREIVCQGSIPAPAGEPIVSAIMCRIHRVYPRACGGTVREGLRRLGVAGLSPRLRGNLLFSFFLGSL